MNTTVKILLAAAGGFALYYFFIRKDEGSSNFSGESSNVTGQTGQNTCKPPREVIQGSCVLRGPSTSKAAIVSQPKVTRKVY